MTEKEWARAAAPAPLLCHLAEASPSPRKLRLVAVAMCRDLGPLLSRKGVRSALDVAERFADGAATARQLEAAWKRADAASQELEEDDKGGAAEAVAAACEAPALFEEVEVYDILDCISSDDRAPRDQRFADLVRDVFGNPFRPVALAPQWRTADAVALAAAMYESRDFAAMPLLADALEEAGCDSGAALAHCRGPGPHARGCWVVDLLLSKE